MNQINENCVKLVKKFESLHDGDLKAIGLQPKMCPRGIWTEGYGSAMIDPDTGRFLIGIQNKDRSLMLQTIHTEEDAVANLMSRLERLSAKAVKVCDRLSLKFDDNKFSALISFGDNCGIGSLSRVLEKYKGGLNMETLLNQYKYSTIDGVKTELRGLMFRRKAEMELFKNGIV